mgnify:FL=1
MDVLIDRVITFLNTLGLHALRGGGTATLPRLRAPMGAVYPLKWTLRPVAAGDILARDGTELLGRLLEAEMAVDIYSPYSGGGAACLTHAENIVTSFSAPLPGFSVSEPTVGECKYNERLDCFICRVTFQASAYRYTAGLAL